MRSPKFGPAFRGLVVSVALVVQALSQEHTMLRRSTLNIPQTFGWNLDDGTIWGRGQSSGYFDFWYEAVTPDLRYLVPLRGATLAATGNRALGYAGCRSSSLSSKKIDFRNLRNGTFVCAHTAQGRYAEFSIDNLRLETDGTLTLLISFITWAE